MITALPVNLPRLWCKTNRPKEVAEDFHAATVTEQGRQKVQWESQLCTVNTMQQRCKTLELHPRR